MIYGFLKKIGLHSAIYGIGNLSYALPGFILLPLYTRFLVPSEYGVFSLLTVLFGILLFIYELGMVGSVSRQFYEYDNEEKRKAVVSTAFFFILAYCLVFTGILFLFKNGISTLLFKTTQYATIIRIGIATVFFQALVFIPQTVIRLRERPVLHISLGTGRVVLLTILTALFIAVFKKGLLGIYQALFITAVIAFAGYMVFTVKNFTFKFNITELKHLLHLGFAFFPALILTWVIESSDRYILNMLTDLSSVGIYSLGYKIGQISMLVVKSFYLGWIPIIFAIVKLDNAPRIFGKLGTYFTIVISLFIFTLSLYSKELISLLATPEYISAYRIVFPICLSYLFYGLHTFFIAGMVIKKSLYSLPLLLFIGAFFNVGLNFLLIPRLGIIGAAIATLISYVTIAFLTYYFSQKNYYIPYEVKKIVTIVLVGLAIYFLGLLPKTGNLYLSAGIKAVSLCAYIASLYIFGIISKRDILMVRSSLAKIIRR